MLCEQTERRDYGDLTSNDVYKLGDRVITGKIPMIKEVRFLTGWGLKQSKDFVDALADNSGFLDVPSKTVSASELRRVEIALSNLERRLIAISERASSNGDYETYVLAYRGDICEIRRMLDLPVN